MAPTLESLAKCLSQLEKAHGLTTKLAVQTDLDVLRERLRRQVIFRLRGELLCKMEELYKGTTKPGRLHAVRETRSAPSMCKRAALTVV